MVSHLGCTNWPLHHFGLCSTQYQKLVLLFVCSQFSTSLFRLPTPAFLQFLHVFDLTLFLSFFLTLRAGLVFRGHYCAILLNSLVRGIVVNRIFRHFWRLFTPLDLLFLHQIHCCFWLVFCVVRRVSRVVLVGNSIAFPPNSLPRTCFKCPQFYLWNSLLVLRALIGLDLDSLFSFLCFGRSLYLLLLIAWGFLLRMFIL